VIEAQALWQCYKKF